MVQERFIADAMLGRLARWLRMLGFDTFYDAEADDHAVMRIAQAEDRIILTRDSDFRRAGVGPCLFVKSDSVEKQLAQVVRTLGLLRPPLPRCPECNGTVENVEDKQDIIDSVPDYIYHTIDRFYRCTECLRVYWEGTHVRNFSDAVKGLFEEE